MLGSEKVFRRGEEGYETARRGPMRHARIPERYPDVVVRAADESDVADAVRMAAAEGLTVAVRSGGHSFSVDPLREGGMLVDLAALHEVKVDADTMSATAGPGRPGSDLCTRLDEMGLFFPGGHCKGVGLGGYLLQGGYGWNSRALGLACGSVTAVDVVTADGALVRADADHEPELYWAARGAGPGFFGIVTRFHLRLHPKPGEFGLRTTIYPVELLDELYTWARDICGEVDRRVEMQLLLGADFELLGVEGPAILVSSAVFADSEEEALAATAIAETCPVKDRARLDLGYLLDAPRRCVRAGDARVPRELTARRRQHVDVGPGRGAPARTALDRRHDAAGTFALPLAELGIRCRAAGHGLLPGGRRVHGAVRRLERRCRRRPVRRLGVCGHMREMAPLTSGVQLADENLRERPAPFCSEETMRRLDAARAVYDPEGRFHSWGGRP